MESTDLWKANLDSACVRKANLKKASFIHGTLTFADLRGADLKGARLNGVDLWRASIAGANLRETTFDERDLPALLDCIGWQEASYDEHILKKLLEYERRFQKQ